MTGSPEAVLTLGFGSWGSAALTLTLGFGVGEAPEALASSSFEIRILHGTPTYRELQGTSNVRELNGTKGQVQV